MIPTGISTGAKITLAKVSHMTTTAEPVKIVAGIRYL